MIARCTSGEDNLPFERRSIDSYLCIIYELSRLDVASGHSAAFLLGTGRDILIYFRGRIVNNASHKQKISI